VATEALETWFAFAVTHRAPDGCRTPRCLALFNTVTGEIIDGWIDQLPPVAPFGQGALLVFFGAPSIHASFAALGWVRPDHVVDLVAEVRNATNGVAQELDTSGAFAHFRAVGPQHARFCLAAELATLPASSPEDKAMLCGFAADCACGLERVFVGCRSFDGYPWARLRGEYAWAAAIVEARGMPVDSAAVRAFGANAFAVRRALAAALAAEGKACSSDSLKALDRFCPPIAADDRMRPQLQPFGTITGRNNPAADHLVIAPGWLRGMLRAPAGRALVLLDWVSQELAIAAVLAGDEALWAVATDPVDPYGRLGRELKVGADAMPGEAVTRSMVKRLCLALLNGAGVPRAAEIIGGNPDVAAHVVYRFQYAFPHFWRWRQAQLQAGQDDRLLTRLGWTLQIGPETKPTTLLNFQIQAHGAEIMRVAMILAVRDGIEVCTPIHDAFLIEVDADKVDDATRAMRAHMDRACEHVLGGGRRIGIKVAAGTHGADLLDPAATRIWHAVMDPLLAEANLSQLGL
jgi:hypothetical protein